MRFERLSVERFGHYESLELDPRGPSGLVVIHGPNEAGKTTLLRAIRGLLFGIDERSTRFATPTRRWRSTRRWSTAPASGSS